MANFDFDQAEGLRRMLAGPQPRVMTFLSATPQDDKGAMLVNLGASLAYGGNEVLLVDASGGSDGVASRLGLAHGASLLDVARQQCGLNQVIHQVPQGFGVAYLGVGARNHLMDSADYAGDDDTRRLGKTFEVMARQSGIVLVDGVVAQQGDCFPVPLMASSDIVVQVSTSATSIKAAYCLVKRLSQELGRRPFGILVTGASESEAKVVYDNMAQAASRYLAVKLTSMGSVPADEYLHRAARLGRSVVDAFPLAGASVAFRALAERLVRSAAPVLGSTLCQTGSAHHFSA
ncbi:MinD/ParA family ATP-binding protein [Janthinobacterium sp. HLX7-2]|uniref:MinD/ParA family ATP-binding protein n=1 Tax=Janthinobacterium sp. HLX7-2 TaxID=1259331 RepID=UPI003F1FED6A